MGIEPRTFRLKLEHHHTVLYHILRLLHPKPTHRESVSMFKEDNSLKSVC